MNGDPKDILGIRSGIPTKPGLEEPVTFDELFDLHDESDKEPAGTRTRNRRRQLHLSYRTTARRAEHKRLVAGRNLIKNDRRHLTPVDLIYPTRVETSIPVGRGNQQRLLSTPGAKPGGADTE